MSELKAVEISVTGPGVDYRARLITTYPSGLFDGPFVGYDSDEPKMSAALRDRLVKELLNLEPAEY